MSGYTASRGGPSERLLEALEAMGYPSVKAGRNQAFADEFGISLATAQRILTGDHVPTRHGLKQKIAKRMKISAAYWEYGIDPYCEDVVGNARDETWGAILRRLKDQGYSLDKIPVGLLSQLARLVYSASRDEGHEIRPEIVDQVIDLSSFLLKDGKGSTESG